jgi:exodeoxyribonuclease X
MPFGKHRGKPIKELPNDYLTWILENLEMRKSLRTVLEAEYERRGRWSVVL